MIIILTLSGCLWSKPRGFSCHVGGWMSTKLELNLKPSWLLHNNWGLSAVRPWIVCVYLPPRKLNFHASRWTWNMFFCHLSDLHFCISVTDAFYASYLVSGLTPHTSWIFWRRKKLGIPGCVRTQAWLVCQTKCVLQPMWPCVHMCMMMMMSAAEFKSDNGPKSVFHVMPTSLNLAMLPPKSLSLVSFCRLKFTI